MKDLDLVSVIIPVCDGEKYLGEAIESVINQTHPAVEIVVVDDGSRDRSAEIARSFPKVRVLSQENQGIGPARNAGVTASRGSLLSFLDADDRFRPDKTASQLEALRADQEADLVLGMAVEFFSPELTAGERPRVRIAHRPVIAEVPISMLIPRPTFERVGPFSAAAAGHGVDWYLRARDMGLKMIRLREVCFERRIHRTNRGVTKRHLQGSRLRVLKDSLDRRRTQS